MREKIKTSKSGAVRALRLSIASAVLFYAHLASHLPQKAMKAAEPIRSA